MEDPEAVSRQQSPAPYASSGLNFCLDPAKLGLSSGQSIPVRVLHRSQTQIELRCADITLLLTCAGLRGTAEDCLEDLKGWILDAIASKLLVGDTAELLLVHPSSIGGVWLCSLQKRSMTLHCNALNADRPAFVSTEYAVSGNTNQFEDLIQIHRAFIELAGPVLLPTTGRDSPVLLRIKVHPGEHWFLRFPLGVFAKFSLTGFESYVACQWIVTNRAISAVAAAQTQTEQEIANTSVFLEGAQIVLNTYTAHARAGDRALIEDGFDLLICLLEHFQTIPIQTHRTSLKWTINPTRDQLKSILTSESTKFLFADFEAAGGFWTLGDGLHRCHDRCDHPSSLTGQKEFDLNPLQGCLTHIRLMRIFHCNSLYDPYKPNFQPADDGTIAAALLATNAFFVECSPTAEPIVDFICIMLGVLLGRADLRTILFAKSLSGGFDMSSLLSRANHLLRKRGFATLV